jgi:hypothetical protein
MRSARNRETERAAFGGGRFRIKFDISGLSRHLFVVRDTGSAAYRKMACFRAFIEDGEAQAGAASSHNQSTPPSAT